MSKVATDTLNLNTKRSATLAAEYALLTVTADGRVGITDLHRDQSRNQDREVELSADGLGDRKRSAVGSKRMAI